MPSLLAIFFIALGGAAGALLRFGVGGYVQHRAAMTLPIGTFAVNIAGCLALGFCYIWLERAPESWRLGVQVGLLGALTTFSTFSLEALRLLNAQRFVAAGAYLGASVVLGLVAAWLGMIAGRGLLA